MQDIHLRTDEGAKFLSNAVLALTRVTVITHRPITDRGWRFELVERGGGDDERALPRATDAQKPGR